MGGCEYVTEVVSTYTVAAGMYTVLVNIQAYTLAVSLTATVSTLATQWL